MLKIHTKLPNAIALVSVAVLLVIVLGAAAYLKMAPPMSSVSAPAGNLASQNVAPASVLASQPSIHSIYISDQTLRNWLDDAYERHQSHRVQTLLHILNGRYERRCCGLPY